MKIISIVGARPQFIKLAPLSREMRRHFDEIIIHTGQHYDVNMAELFFQDLSIPIADYNLGIGSGSHGKQTAAMISSIEDVLKKELPDTVIVFGDTNSTLAGVLAAVKMHIPIIHVEAGLRSFNREMPEEVNRVVADHVSDHLFAPTSTAFNNLRKEGLEDRSYLTGDIMVDALFDSLDRAKERKDLLTTIGVIANHYYLLTLHRPYNVDDGKRIAKLLEELAQLDYPVVFAVHPRTKSILEKYSISVDKKIELIDPVGYLDFLCLQYYSKKIITDSGGIQKEAFLISKPCITLRTETEWVETVEEGWNLLVNPNTLNLKESISTFSPKGESKNVFGSNVAKNMVNIIINTIS